MTEATEGRDPSRPDGASGAEDTPLWRQKGIRRTLRHPELVALVRELFLQSEEAVTVDEVRRRAVVKGLLTGKETGRQLSFLSSVMRAAGGKPVGYARSTTPSRNRAVVALWVKRDD